MCHAVNILSLLFVPKSVELKQIFYLTTQEIQALSAFRMQSLHSKDALTILMHLFKSLTLAEARAQSLDLVASDGLTPLHVYLRDQRNLWLQQQWFRGSCWENIELFYQLLMKPSDDIGSRDLTFDERLDIICTILGGTEDKLADFSTKRLQAIIDQLHLWRFSQLKLECWLIMDRALLFSSDGSHGVLKEYFDTWIYSFVFGKTEKSSDVDDEVSEDERLVMLLNMMNGWNEKALEALIMHCLDAARGDSWIFSWPTILFENMRPLDDRIHRLWLLISFAVDRMEAYFPSVAVQSVFRSLEDLLEEVKVFTLEMK
jgi:hypothetical protein